MGTSIWNGTKTVGNSVWNGITKVLGFPFRSYNIIVFNSSRNFADNMRDLELSGNIKSDGFEFYFPITNRGNKVDYLLKIGSGKVTNKIKDKYIENYEYTLIGLGIGILKTDGHLSFDIDYIIPYNSKIEQIQPYWNASINIDYELFDNITLGTGFELFNENVDWNLRVGYIF